MANYSDEQIARFVPLSEAERRLAQDVTEARRERDAAEKALTEIDAMCSRQLAEPVGQNGDTALLVNICGVCEALAAAREGTAT